jgi:uncharacterized protein YggU (UPF0235/DUF167 family)
MSFFEPYKNGYIVRIKLFPNAACCAVRGIFTDVNGDEYLKISVNAAPEKGKANKELLSWMAKNLKIAKNSLTIISGTTDHLKKIYLDINTSSETNDKLTNFAKENI